jgi:hypothetical protein
VDKTTTEKTQTGKKKENAPNKFRAILDMTGDRGRFISLASEIGRWLKSNSSIVPVP